MTIEEPTPKGNSVPFSISATALIPDPNPLNYGPTNNAFCGDVPTAKVTRVQFGGTGFHAVTKDDGTLYSSPQFLSDSGSTITNPVSYTSGSTLNVQATFTLSQNSGCSIVQVTGTGPDGIVFQGTASHRIPANLLPYTQLFPFRLRCRSWTPLLRMRRRTPRVFSKT